MGFSVRSRLCCLVIMVLVARLLFGIYCSNDLGRVLW